MLDRSPQSLAGIARFWEIELRGPDLHHDVSLLYRTLTDPWNFALAWEVLPTAEQAVLRTFADGIARDSDKLSREVIVDQDDLLPTIRKLYKAGYLYHTISSADESHMAVELFMPPELASMTAHLVMEQEAGDPRDEPVPVLLERLDEAWLIEMARDLGYSFIPAISQRAELAGYLETRLTDPDYIESAIKALDPPAARLWHWLIQRMPPAGPSDAGIALGFSSIELRSAIQTLARLGLVWRGYGLAGEDRGLRLVVPAAIRNPRRPEPVSLPDLVDVDANRVVTGHWIHPSAAAWDLLTLLRERAVRSSGSLSRDVGHGAAVSRRAGPHLWRGISGTLPNGYLAFLDYIAAGLGLVTDRNALAPVIERLTPWTRLSFEEQTRQMIDLWRNAAEWFEGVSTESFHAWGADWRGMRRSLLSSLSELGDDRWYTLDSVALRFAASHPSALGTHVTIAAANTQFEPPAASRHQGVVRRAAELTLTTAGAWLGLVELAGLPKEPRLIRLTRLGSMIASDIQALAEESEREAPLIAVQPNFEILLITPSPRRVWALSAFADLLHLDRVSIYRLSEQSSLRSLDAGVSVRNVVRFLEHQSGTPLPQNVAYAMSEWERQHRMVRIRESVLLDLDGEPVPGDFERILREGGIAAERLPGDRLLVPLSQVDDVADFVERIARILRESGHIPRRS